MQEAKSCVSLEGVLNTANTAGSKSAVEEIVKQTLHVTVGMSESLAAAV